MDLIKINDKISIIIMILTLHAGFNAPFKITISMALINSSNAQLHTRRD